MTQVAILWHMHQPYYEDLVTREHILPWVRMHAIKDYYGMVALLREFPSVRVTFNLVPSLLVQLESFAADRARDRYLEVGLKPAADLSPAEIAFMLQNFFHAQRQRMIDPYPRYADLLARRGPSFDARDGATAARRFGVDDLRDLQVWQKLAWIDPFFLDRDPRVRDLVARGTRFSEEDKITLRQVELELLNAVIPEYRDAAARGQIEISTSPFYHPILPLLCDTEVYKRTHPHSAMPRRRFTHPEDAAEQLSRAAVYHERLFGRAPVGLWPSEGSVSDAMVPLARAAGFEWMATDELILARTLGTTFGRDGHGHVVQPERLYSPYRVAAGEAEIGCLFRDHVLSDLIGFTYAGWNADAAADDFTTRLAEAGRRYRDATGGREAVIPIMLDGENAWEHFEGGGRPFLRALYGRLSNHPDLKTVTMREAATVDPARLDGIFPGSWIDANFYIWIGHRDDHRAWGQLADAREALAAAGRTASPTIERAREEILIAEGSDWFWWYGDDHSSDQDEDFDDLFRRHLRNVYRLLDRAVPDELFASNISTRVPPPIETQPSGLLHPTLDGEQTSYFEWLGAGQVELRDTAGAMHQAERAPRLLTAIHFGFDVDLSRFYVRLDATRPVRDLVEREGLGMTIRFLDPDGVRLSIGAHQGLQLRMFEKVPGVGSWVERTNPGTTAGTGEVLEVAVPLAELRRSSDGPSTIAFIVTVHDAAGNEIERHPAQGPIQVGVPDASFRARNWTV